jgi:hypothetical protein
MLKRKGHYFGTEIDEKWWRRYTKKKLFARGTGEYWYDDDSFYFRRYLTRTPIVLHFRDITDLKTGHWHAGRWGGRHPIIKFIWQRDGLRLGSGFLLSKHDDVTEQLLNEFSERMQLHR